MKHRLEYAAVLAVRFAIGVLPSVVASALGAMVGLAFYTLDRAHRRVALTNLTQSFPRRTPAELRKIARGMFRHFGRLLFEMLKFSTLSDAAMRRRVEFEGEDRARHAYAQGKGVLFFTGHFGFWELHAIVHGLQLEPIGVLARALDNPYLNRLLEDLRTRTGNSVIYRQGAVRRVLKTLNAGQGVAMLIDQHMHGPDAIWVDFFERPAATTSALAALALRTGAPVVPVFALPLPGGRYRMIYEHAVAPPAADSLDAIRDFTQRCTDVLEMYVRRHPELWLWMHRRWREAPVGEWGQVTRNESAIGNRQPATENRQPETGHRKPETGNRSDPESKPPPQRLVVLAPNWLGDAVMALPLLADIQRAWPDTAMVVAARASVAPLFAMVPGIADVIRLEGSGRTALSTWRQNARRLEAGHFDAALLLPNSFLAAWIVARAGIAERWGFARDRRGWLLTRAIQPPQRRVHQAEYYQSLAPALGIHAGDRVARLAPDAAARARAAQLLRESGIADGQRFIVFAPGAAYGRAKQWLPERFAELAVLLREADITTVLVGTAADAATCRQIVKVAERSHPGRDSRRTSPTVDLSGRTDLATLAAILAASAATVANDSGVMHLAGVVGTRLAAIFGPTSARRTSPLRAHVNTPAAAIVATDVWCRPCMLRECPIDHRCMTGISARAVFDALALE